MRGKLFIMSELELGLTLKLSYAKYRLIHNNLVHPSSSY